MLATRSFARNEPVEGGLPADDAIDEFLAQTAIRSGQGLGRERVIEEVFDVVAARATVLQELRRNLSWFLPRHAA